jgi:hypothetical protein
VAFGLLLSTAAFGQPGAGAAQPKAPARAISVRDAPQDIVDRSVAAFGGLDKLARWGVGRVRYTVRGGPGFPGPFPNPPPGADVVVEETFQLPGHYKRVVSARSKDEHVVAFTWVINNGKGWERPGQGSARPMEGGRYHERTRQMLADFFDISVLRGRGRRLSVVGQDKLASGTAVVVRWEAGGGQNTDFFFDQESALPVRTVKAMGLGTATETRSEVTLAGYKRFDGGMVPTRIVLRQGGKLVMEMRVEDVTFAGKFNADVFGKP